MGLHPYIDERKTKCTLGGESDNDLLQSQKTCVNCWPKSVERQAKKACQHVFCPVRGNIGP